MKTQGTVQNNFQYKDLLITGNYYANNNNAMQNIVTLQCYCSRTTCYLKCTCATILMEYCVSRSNSLWGTSSLLGTNCGPHKEKISLWDPLGSETSRYAVLEVPHRAV